MSEQNAPRTADQHGEDAPFSFTDKRTVNSDGSVKAAAEGAAPAGPGTGEQPAADAATAQSGSASPAEADAATAEVTSLKERVAELEEQLKREQAEYVNSRRRIEQSAELGKQNAVAGVLTSLMSVLDDIELARQHGDLGEGTPFASIAAKLENALGQHGLNRFGAVGEEFDPNRHDALMHEDGDGETTTLAMVMQPGYAMHDRVLRPARVATKG